jgi:hypothetical protein
MKSFTSWKYWNRIVGQDAIVQCREHTKILGHKIQIKISARADFLQSLSRRAHDSG